MRREDQTSRRTRFDALVLWFFWVYCGRIITTEAWFENLTTLREIEGRSSQSSEDFQKTFTLRPQRLGGVISEAAFMRIFLSSIGLLFVAAVGCATGGEKSPGPDQAQQKQSKSEAVTDYPSLIKSLRALGAGATAAGDVEQPFFSITGLMIKVHGENVQVFQYSSAGAMEAQAARISRDGMAVGTSKIHWLGPPHFFKKEKLLVLYIGDEAKTLKALEAALGRQFAGQ